MKDTQMALMLAHAWFIASLFMPSGPRAFLAGGIALFLGVAVIIDRLRK